MPSIGTPSIIHLQDPIPSQISATEVNAEHSTDLFVANALDRIHGTDVLVGSQTNLFLKYELLGSSDIRERPLFNYEFPQTIFVVLE